MQPTANTPALSDEVTREWPIYAFVDDYGVAHGHTGYIRWSTSTPPVVVPADE